MGIFNSIFKKLDSPVIYKEKQASAQISELEKLLKQKLPEDTRKQIKQEIYQYQTGEQGEKQVRYILKNSYMPMYILHDVYLKEKGLTAQIDFLVITRKLILVIECKNYSSDIRIDRNGQFMLLKKDGSKQGIPDPTEQNRRHKELICKMFPELKKRCFPIVVFTHEHMLLHTDKAPEDICQQVVKADKLVRFIRNLHETVQLSDLSDAKMKSYADTFREKHTDNPVDYTAKYRKSAKSKKEEALTCPHCHKPVLKGAYGWYCSRKCGMQIAKVYGTELSDTQISSLLHGKSVRCTTKSGMTSVLPEIEKNTYQGKISYQWKTKRS